MKRLAVLLCLFLMACLAAPACASLYDAGYVCNPDPADRLNLRAKPSTGAVSLGKFYNGTPVVAQSIDGDWAKVTICGVFSGYMHMDFLAFEPTPSAMPTVTITAPMGKEILSDMTGDAQVLARLVIGAQMEVIGVMEDWLFVQAGDIQGFTPNSGTMPRVTFSIPEETPRMHVSLIATPTPSPTPVPTASQQAYASVPIEGARPVTEDDWINFASIKNATTLYADKALTRPIRALEKGEMIRIFNETSSYATFVADGRIAGYFPAAQTYTVHTSQWPFHIDRPSAMVNNPLVSDRLHLRQSPSQSARSLGRYYNGTVVTLLDSFDGSAEWTAVQIGGVSGYMKSEYLDFSPDPNEHHPCLNLYEVNNSVTGDLYLRTAPDTDSAPLGLYPNGTLVAVIGVTGDWVHVICDGQTGFMLHRHLRTSLGTSYDPYQ